MQTTIFRVVVEGKLSTPRKTQAGVPQGYDLPPTLYNLYTNDITLTPEVQLALFDDDTYVCMQQTAKRAML
jgi:hypothetical protein